MDTFVIDTDLPADALPTADRESILAAAEQACRRVAPLWPLDGFVAVNPYLGFSDTRFVEAAARLGEAAGARLTADRPVYAEAIASGRISSADLRAALADAAVLEPGAESVAKADRLADAATQPQAPRVEPLPTVADVAARVTERDWDAFVVDRISSFAASWFDDAQAAWRVADGPSLWASWREQASIDRTPEIMGLSGFRRVIDKLPSSADGMLVDGVTRLGLGGRTLDRRFHRLLMTVGGWAALARHRVWQSELHGGTSPVLRELLAVRLAWEVALLECLRDRPDGPAASGTNLVEAWAAARATPQVDATARAELKTDALLQAALEKSWQRDLFARLDAARDGSAASASTRPAAQAAFCIDVRSEVFRRALESVAEDIDTIGFAGFFGVPIEYVPLGERQGAAHCPVLLAPGYTIRETVVGADETAVRTLVERRGVRRRAIAAWRAFQRSAVASFGFVETMGWLSFGKLAGDAFGLTRPVTAPATAGVEPAARTRLGPELEPRSAAGRETGIGSEQRVDIAAAVLAGMSLRDGFAPLVALIGHGSSTVNNPHATGLDCGACGSRTGEASARVVAAILNDVAVRDALGGRGIAIPIDTRFIACLHDTTTDRITVFDRDTVPDSYAAELAALEARFADAGRLARTERAASLALEAGGSIDRQILARANDWSQVRPEWGLAGCAAFIAAPRRRTRGLDLGGRSFLHSYDWRSDEQFATLELIMTAPMVVASWISLQYYGSTVDNAVFGSGDKTLHNVVGGTLGVLEGNGGDLRVGLPLQSVHDGERAVHEALRLTVAIAAPTDAIDAVMDKHAGVRELVENGWLYLFALGDEGQATRAYRPGDGWYDWPG